MRGKGMVALGRVVLSKRERVIMLQPWDKGIMGTTVRYPYEVRDSKDYFYDIADVKVQPDLLQLAEHILKNQEASFDPTQFVDRYEQAVLEVLKTKQEGTPAAKPQSEAQPRNVINLFDALRASLGVEKKEAKQAKPTAAAKPGKKAAKGNPNQREMLLPISVRKFMEPARLSRARSSRSRKAKIWANGGFRSFAPPKRSTTLPVRLQMTDAFVRRGEVIP
jgi:DNA end-binding protein Ku